MYCSPLRYPGGKTKLYPVVEMIVNQCETVDTYIEPFAGGAGIALNLLFENKINKIVINDFDNSVYSIWKAILFDTDEFLNKIENTDVNISEWHRQREIYLKASNNYSLELAFATFFLNRTNRSGIINARPIGGLFQEGAYSLQARYNKNELIRRIKNIANRKDQIDLFNMESLDFIEKIIPKHKNALIYYDPPYYCKGQELYKNFFEHKDHELLGEKIIESNIKYWVVTYDNVLEIKNIYKGLKQYEYTLNYSLSRKCKSKEVMILSNDIVINFNDPKIERFCFTKLKG